MTNLENGQYMKHVMYLEQNGQIKKQIRADALLLRQFQDEERE